MEKLITIFKALSDKNRLRIVSALMKYDELCACQLTELIQVSSATASRHMGVLLSSNIVESRKEGRWVYYRLCREFDDLQVLIDWIDLQLQKDPSAKNDEKELINITSQEPEDICRKQRGVECCP